MIDNKTAKEMEISDLEQLAREEGNIEYAISLIMDMCMTYNEQRNALYYILNGEEID